MLDVNKVLELENNERYLVLDKIEHDNKEYYYIAKVNESETDIENNFKLVTVEEQNGEKLIVEVTGEENLKEILPKFVNEI